MVFVVLCCCRRRCVRSRWGWHGRDSHVHRVAVARLLMLMLVLVMEGCLSLVSSRRGGCRAVHPMGFGVARVDAARIHPVHGALACEAEDVGVAGQEALDGAELLGVVRVPPVRHQKGRVQLGLVLRGEDLRLGNAHRKDLLYHAHKHVVAKQRDVHVPRRAPGAGYRCFRHRRCRRHLHRNPIRVRARVGVGKAVVVVDVLRQLL
mmetsp:Transcript_1095/g.2548  ORF Transcript_1095/g.2548 Transcript_1095/m.2548 type:complete len:206 (+) Transcript_1095:145-762(+)